MRDAWIHTLAPPVVLLTTCAMAWSQHSLEMVDGPLRRDGFVGYLQAETVKVSEIPPWPGLRGKVVAADESTGRYVLILAPGSGRGEIAVPRVSQSVEMLVLSGRVQFGSRPLERLDFVFVPPATDIPTLTADGEASLLVFIDPPSSDPEVVSSQQARGIQWVSHADDGWEPAQVALPAGVTARLEIFHLKRDPDTTARTWLVSLSGSMKIPWEVHSMIEEGFLVQGQYRLAECLPSGTVVGEYREGGYFRRPAGVPHSGPESGPLSHVIWLQRAPVALDVTFHDGCVDGRAISEASVDATMP